MKDTDQELKSISIEAFNVFYDLCLDEIAERLNKPFTTGLSREFKNKHWHSFFEQYQKDKDVTNAVDWYFGSIKPTELTDNERKVLTNFINRKYD